MFVIVCLELLFMLFYLVVYAESLITVCSVCGFLIINCCLVIHYVVYCWHLQTLNCIIAYSVTLVHK